MFLYVYYIIINFKFTITNPSAPLGYSSRIMMDYVFRWLNGTILATGHGADDPSININNWLTYILGDFLDAEITKYFYCFNIYISTL